MSETNSEIDIDEFESQNIEQYKNENIDLSNYYNNNLNLDELPDDIYKLVFPYLSKRDILNLRCVNKELNHKVTLNYPNNILFNVNKEKLCQYNNYLKNTKITRKTKDIEENTNIEKISLPKSIFFDGRLLFNNKIIMTIKQLESTNMNCVGMINMVEINNHIRNYRNIRCIITKRVDENGIYQMSLLNKLNHLIIVTDLYKRSKVISVLEDSLEHNNILSGIVPKPGKFNYYEYNDKTKRNIINYFDLVDTYDSISYLNKLPKIKTITLKYIGYKNDDSLLINNNIVDFKPGIKYNILHHVTKLNIERKYNSQDFSELIDFDVLNMFRNLNCLNIKSRINSNTLYALLLMDKLEELHLDTCLHDTDTCILYEVIKKLKILSIPFIPLTLNDYNTNYNFFNKFIGNKEYKLGNIIDYPKLECLYIKGNILDKDLPTFSNLKKLAISINLTYMHIIYKLLVNVQSLILNVVEEIPSEYMLETFYKYEFLNVKELTIISHTKDSILALHMFPNITKLNIVFRNIKFICNTLQLINSIPHIKSLSLVKDLIVYNLDTHSDIIDNNDKRNYFNKKLPKINIMLSERINVIGVDKLIKHLLLKT